MDSHLSQEDQASPDVLRSLIGRLPPAAPKPGTGVRPAAPPEVLGAKGRLETKSRLGDE